MVSKKMIIIVTIKQHNQNYLMAENLDIIPIDWRWVKKLVTQ